MMVLLIGVCFFLPFRWWYVLSAETSLLGF